MSVILNFLYYIFSCKYIIIIIYNKILLFPKNTSIKNLFVLNIFNIFDKINDCYLNRIMRIMIFNYPLCLIFTFYIFFILCFISDN